MIKSSWNTISEKLEMKNFSLKRNPKYRLSRLFSDKICEKNFLTLNLFEIKFLRIKVMKFQNKMYISRKLFYIK
uniref:CSON002162 protein n=1 Tax=Culicoides sonorensis TaxID=179676 RepID=A0A336KZU6_CULSO